MSRPLSAAGRAPLAHERLLGLVCGYSGDQRRLRQLLVLKAYIDGSGSKGQPSLVMAGHIAPVEQWLAFSDEWGDLLRLLGRPCFKMSEMASQPEFVAAFYRIIENHVPAAVACAIPCDTLVKVARDLGLPPIYENPYYLGFKAIVNFTAQYQGQMGLHEPVDFIFDDQSEKVKIREAWDAYVQAVTPDVRALTGREPIFERDEEIKPLQAADLYAWWMRKLWAEKGTLLTEGLPFPWTRKKKIPRLMLGFDEEAIALEYRKIRDLMVSAGQLSPTFTLNVSFDGLNSSEERRPWRRDGEG